MEEEKRKHRCCFTGHRPEKLGEPEETVKAWLSEQIDQAISDGYVTFVCGCAMGADLWAGQCVIDKRKTAPIHLIAVTPFPTFSYRWSEEWKAIYQQVWNGADYRVTISKEYNYEAFEERSHWLVDHSSRIIAYYNGDPGGAKNMILYAEKKGLSVVVGGIKEAEIEELEISEGKPYPYNLLLNLSSDAACFPDQPEDFIRDCVKKERDYQLLLERYRDRKTLQAIGDEEGISRERVRQIIGRTEKKIWIKLEKLSKPKE